MEKDQYRIIIKEGLAMAAELTHNLEEMIGERIIRYKPTNGRYDSFSKDPIILTGIYENHHMSVQYLAGTFQYILESTRPFTKAPADRISAQLDKTMMDDGWILERDIPKEPTTELTKLEGKLVHRIANIDSVNNGFMKGEYLLLLARKYHLKIRYEIVVYQNGKDENGREIKVPTDQTKTIELYLDARYCKPEDWEEVKTE